MGTQAYRDQYRAAFHQANSDLAEIFGEYERLQIRKEQIEDVLIALEPFLPHLNVQIEAIRQVIPPVATSEQVSPRMDRELQLNPGPIAPGVPVAAKADMDPIQRRINSALGLAVA